jgi:hypothetical protein
MDQELTDPTYTALHLAEEHACKRYLAARRELVAVAAHAASLGQLATEHPHRLDYQAAWREAVLAQSRAMTRTGSAWTLVQHARRRTDAAAPPPALSVAFSAPVDPDSEAA